MLRTRTPGACSIGSAKKAKFYADDPFAWQLAAVNGSLVPYLRPARTPSRLDGPCAWAAWLLPLVLGVWGASGEPTWADDLALMRDLGGVPVGSDGVLSTAASQLIALLPVGGRLLRASWLGAVALAACGWLFYELLRDLLDAHEPFGLNPLLALLGCQLWVLDPQTLLAASRVGGPALALLVMLCCLRVTRDLSDARAFPLAGGLIALCAAENHAAGAILALAFSVRVFSAGDRLKPAQLHAWLGGFFSVAAVCASWRALRAFSLGAGLDLGFTEPAGLALGESAAADGVASFARSWLLLWRGRIDLVPLALAFVGGGWALSRGPELRRAVAPFGIFAAAGGFVPLLTPSSDASWPPLLGLASSLGVLAFVPLSLRAGVGWLWSCRLPLARPAGVLAVTFAVTIVLRHLDEVDPGEPLPAVATHAWTEEALEKLPPRSLVLVRSPVLALRLLAARALRGERPDVIVVPVPFLASGPLMLQLLRLEPDLSPLLRQLSIHGLADEYSLCRLADVRPVFVELDREWDIRLLEHLRPEPIWLGFSAHALGASERDEGVARSHAALRRVWRAPSQDDPRTRRVLADGASDQAALLAALGERRDARWLLRLARRLAPADPLARGLRERLLRTRRGRVAISDLVDEGS